MGRAPKRNFIFQPIDFPKAKHVSFRGGWGRLYKMIFPNPSQNGATKTGEAYFCERFFAIVLASCHDFYEVHDMTEGWKR